MKILLFEIYFILAISILACTYSKSNKDIEFDELKEYARDNYDKHNYTEAYKSYQSLLKIDSLNGEFYFNKGRAEAGLQMFIEARNDFFHAIKLNYRKADSYYNIGLTYLFKNDSLAIQYLQKCLQIQPNDKDAKGVLESLKSRQRNIIKQQSLF